ncbi:hypothetical protein D3C74_23810 [compost metagenome]
MSDQYKTSADDWKSYIQGQAIAKEEARLENMLMDQEEAVAAFLRQLEQEEDALPQLGDVTAFTDRIMASLPDSTEMVGTEDGRQLPEPPQRTGKASTAIGLVQTVALDETARVADKHELTRTHKKAETTKSTENIPSHDRVKRWYHRKWAHYAIAASITLICSYTGAFDQLSPAEPLHSQPDFYTGESVSEEVMNAATGWLDRMQGR